MIEGLVNTLSYQELQETTNLLTNEVGSVWMARIILDLLGWIKTRKGMLPLTIKGTKASTKIDVAANEIVRFSLVGVGMNNVLAGSDRLRHHVASVFTLPRNG